MPPQVDPNAVQNLLALLSAASEKAVGETSNYGGQFFSQPGGLFATPGLDNSVISLHVRSMGIGGILPAFPSDTDDPRYGFLVGVSDEYGDEPDGPCDDGPMAYMKAGTLTAQFGRVTRKTETIVPTEILRTSRGANTNLRLIGEMLGEGEMVPRMNSQGILNLAVKAQMVGVGVMLERVMNRMLWQGTPANNNAGGGYKEFPGLDAQIATGQVDAETGTAMPSADSFIVDFGYEPVDSATNNIVAVMSEVEYHLNYLADRTGVGPVEWVIAMRPQLWQELSAVWACQYLADRCTTPANSQVSVNIGGAEQIRMRDDMRNNMYITINGRRYRVVTDDGMYEDRSGLNGNLSAGEYSSEIVWLPLRINGRFPSTYWEFVDYGGINRQLSAIPGFARNMLPFWTDAGRFLWTMAFYRQCFDLQATVEPRVILRTPHLAAKIQNVMYSPMQHLRDPYPDSPYWVNGGVSMRTALTDGQAVWK